MKYIHSAWRPDRERRRLKYIRAEKHKQKKLKYFRHVFHEYHDTHFRKDKCNV